MVEKYPILSKIIYRYQIMNMPDARFICNQPNTPKDKSVFTYLFSVYNYETNLTDIQKQVVLRSMIANGLCSVLKKNFMR